MNPEGAAPTDDEHVDTHVRLAQVAQNARTSWFGLLALLVFVGVTLMGHRDSDFFAFGAETELPLVGLSVPTVSFFIAAPTLTAALYVYLHIYLHGLWTALAHCPPRIGQRSRTLEEHAYPTMLCTAALVVRRWLRQETDKPVEGSRVGAVSISLLMVWLSGPFVLAVLWWRSMPYHDEWMTLWAGLWFWLTLVVGAGSLIELCHVMRFRRPISTGRSRFLYAEINRLVSAGLLAVLLAVSWSATEGGRFAPLAAAALDGRELTRKPADWLHYNVWLEDWTHKFRIRECPGAVASGGPCPSDKLDQFQRKTARRWETLTQSLDSPDLQRADLRGASLIRAFLTGSNLISARLQDADLRGAWLEGAQLMDAQLQRADLTKARLAGADLRDAKMLGIFSPPIWGTEATAFPFGVWLKDTLLLGRLQRDGPALEWVRPPSAWERVVLSNWLGIRGTRFSGADLRGARMQGIDLRRVEMEGADLRHARLDGADLRAAALPGADLRGASLKEANLGGLEVSNRAALYGGGVERERGRGNVPMGGANLRWAQLEGTQLRGARLEGANLTETVGLDQTQLDQACGDEHTQLPNGLSIPTCAD